MSSNISGKRIKELREKKEINQVELAAALSVDHDIKLDRSDVGEIERGVRGVKDYELNALAKVLDVDPTWLLRGDETES
jgi:transcriptional regulator with XRE-family HTH domain